MKYYAYYVSPSYWHLFSEEEYNEHVDWLSVMGRSNEAACFNEYASKKEAVRYLVMHLRGDRNEAIHSLKELRGC